MAERPRRSGYVRCDEPYTDVGWTLQVLSEEPKLAVVLLDTTEGRVVAGLNRSDAEHLIKQLTLFLSERPSDAKVS